jgi:hypothetical protein
MYYYLEDEDRQPGWREQDEDPRPGWDGQPWLEVRWVGGHIEKPVGLDEFLETWNGETAITEFAANEPRIDEWREFDVGCNANVCVRRVA